MALHLDRNTDLLTNRNADGDFFSLDPTPMNLARRIWQAGSPWRLLVELAGLALLYGLGWQVLAALSHGLWFLPAGLRLGALWVSSPRRWGAIAVGEWSALLLAATQNGQDLLDPSVLVLVVSPCLIYALVVLMLRGYAGHSDLDSPGRMLLLIGTGLLSAAMVSPVLSYYLPDAGQAHGGLAGTFAFLFGDFIGQLVMAPLLILALTPDLRQRLHAGLWLDTGLQVAFSTTVFWLLLQRAELAPYLLMLGFVPIFFVAFRRGWEGAAVSVALVGLLNEILMRLHLLPVDVGAPQLTLAVIGSGGLVLGAASTTLRRSHEHLALRHRELEQANRDLTQTSSELRNVSQRLVRLEEQGQRELAGELDYEMGQAIHALSTRISLAFREVRDPQMLRLLESMREQVRELQGNLRRVVRQLRPQILDSQGLRQALAAGPLREMLEDAGVVFDASYFGRIEALSNDAQTAVYRICQAAVRKVSQMEAVHRLAVKLSVMPSNAQGLQVELEIDIEVSPFLEFPIDSTPLPAITDRVLALQGGYQVIALTPGVRHRVQFEEATASLL